MRPKKAKVFIPIVAEEKNLPEDCVEEIINFYWEEIRKSLSSLKQPRIHVTNLGDFVTKHWKIDDKINSLQNWEESNKQKGLQQITARFKTAETLYELKELKKLLEEENQRKDFIKLHKRKSNGSKG